MPPRGPGCGPGSKLTPTLTRSTDAKLSPCLSLLQCTPAIIRVAGREPHSFRVLRRALHLPLDHSFYILMPLMN